MTDTVFTTSERRLTIAGVMVVFLLSALYQTIVSTAMPKIVSELNGLTLYAWVTTAYLLTSTVAVPIWGKLGDLYGRKPALLGSIAFFLLGSWLSGLSGEFGDLPILGSGMTQLITFRAIQGIGGGGLFTIAFTIIGDLYPPRERAKLGGIFAAVFGLSSTLGPLIGGYFTDLGTTHLFSYEVAGWRWAFYVNVPIALLSLFVILALMPKMSHQARGKIDFIGAFLIIATIVPLLLALTFGGRDRAWDSPLIIALFAGSVLGLVLYIIAERYASDPIIPLSLFKNRVFSTANLSGFLVSMSFMSTAAFLPLFLQIGQGVDATTSGLSTLPLMVGLMAGSIGSGQLVARTKKTRPFILGGLALTFVATLLLSLMSPSTGRIDLALRMLLLGLGLGPGQSIFNLIIQSSVTRDQLGVVTGANQFFRQIGATVGVALFGTLMTHHMGAGLSRIMPGADIGKLQSMSAGAGAAAHALPPAVREVMANAVTSTMAWGLITVAAAAVVALLIPRVSWADRPTTSHRTEEAAEEAAEQAAEAVGSPVAAKSV